MNMRDYPTFDILYFKTMYVYWYIVFIVQCCVFTKFLNLQIKRQETFNILLEFPFGCLQHVPCLSSGYCAPLYIRNRVPGNFIHLVDI